MVVDEVVNASANTLFGNVVVEIGKIGLLIQALGLIVVIWIVFEIISLIVNRKRRKALYRIEDRLDAIEKKINRLLKK